MSNLESFGGYPDSDSGDEARFRNLTDTAGFPINAAYKAVYGIDPDQLSAPRPRVSLESRHPSVSRRGGRSYPEASDSELDPYWNQPVEPLAGEKLAAQQAVNRRGRRLADQILWANDLDRIRDESERRGVPFEVLLRARNARRDTRDV